MPPRKQQNDLSSILSTLTDGLERVALRPDSNSYRAHDKQTLFHMADAKGRLYIGGNRSGKTVAGIVEDIWWLTGKHPYRQTPEGGVRGRLVCVDFPNGWTKIIKPVLTQWIPPSALIDGSWTASWSEREKRLTLENGSFLEIMSYDQEIEAFAGASRHFTHFDEEPPKDIWTECRARLVDTGGSWWITMTPVQGMTWVYDDIYEPWLENNTKFVVVQVDITDNIYVSPVEIEDFLAGMDENELKARKEGKFVQLGGLIFKDFDPSIHVIEPIFDKLGSFLNGTMKITGSMDHGLNNPTSFNWHITLPDNTVITFYEHYRSEWTVSQHAKKVNEIERELGLGNFSRWDKRYWADPATRQRNAVSKTSIQLEYRKNGVLLVPANNDVSIRLNRMVNYERGGKWLITSNCPNLIREKRRYRWKTRESRKLQAKHGNFDEPHKKDDHGIDSCGYYFVSLPELRPSPPVAKSDQSTRQQMDSILKPKTGVNAFVGRKDTSLARAAQNSREFKFVTDEMMGGEW